MLHLRRRSARSALRLSLFDDYTGLVAVVLGLVVTDIAVTLHKLRVARGCAGG